MSIRPQASTAPKHTGTRLDDPEFVRREYSSGEAHAVRMQMFEELREGPHADDIAINAVAEVAPARVVEVGCGDGAFAVRVASELGCEVVSLDLSARAVALARKRGANASIGDVQNLLFASGTFDCAVAKWMLYHVPDLDRGISELARVLRPGGRLVAVTLSEETLPELWRMLGDSSQSEVSFSRENGQELLLRHFSRVERHDIDNVLVFRCADELRRYVAASMMRPHLVDRVPDFEGPFRAATRCCMFVADTTA
jgi:ubiquinone/menaquinone biosynthesis C-methylase UbiE